MSWSQKWIILVLQGFSIIETKSLFQPSIRDLSRLLLFMNNVLFRTLWPWKGTTRSAMFGLNRHLRQAGYGSAPSTWGGLPRTHQWTMNGGCNQWCVSLNQIKGGFKFFGFFPSRGGVSLLFPFSLAWPLWQLDWENARRGDVRGLPRLGHWKPGSFCWVLLGNFAPGTLATM